MPDQRTTAELDLQDAHALVPFYNAGMRGLGASQWHPGMSAEDLVAPIVGAVLAEVARQLPLDQLTDALTARATPPAGRDLSHHISRAATYYQETGHGHDL